LCGRLDGIPLAIELAAARVRVLAPHEILERLDDRFELLTGGDRHALARQQTLRATVDWSHELLEGSERKRFRRLAVFAGGWSSSDAEQVCADEACPSTWLAGDIAEGRRWIDEALASASAPTLERARALHTAGSWPTCSWDMPMRAGSSTRASRCRGSWTTRRANRGRA
jgi:predicted ATPase